MEELIERHRDEVGHMQIEINMLAEQKRMVEQKLTVNYFNIFNSQIPPYFFFCNLVIYQKVIFPYTFNKVEEWDNFSNL